MPICSSPREIQAPVSAYPPSGTPLPGSLAPRRHQTCQLPGHVFKEKGSPTRPFVPLCLLADSAHLRPVQKPSGRVTEGTNLALNTLGEAAPAVQLKPVQRAWSAETREKPKARDKAGGGTPKTLGHRAQAPTSATSARSTSDAAWTSELLEEQVSGPVVQTPGRRTTLYTAVPGFDSQFWLLTPDSFPLRQILGGQGDDSGTWFLHPRGRPRLSSHPCRHLGSEPVDASFIGSLSLALSLLLLKKKYIGAGAVAQWLNALACSAGITYRHGFKT